jgi:DNA-binding NarL/FixJ family response regulator
LVKAIESVFNGNTCFTHPESSLTGNNHSEDYFLKTFKLTYRELDVLRLIKEGIETQEIADRLHISRLTVETHRKNICTKLNLRGRNELLKFALENDI